MIDVPEIQDPKCERGRAVAMEDGKHTDGQHPAWCSPQHCFATDEGVLVHIGRPSRMEAECVVPLRFETCLIDPGDDDTYLELRLRNLKLRDEFYSILPLDAARALRDQLTAHLNCAAVAAGDAR